MADGGKSQAKLARVALYIDGFNLYHPIRRMGAKNNHLKWACLWQLGLRLLKPDQTLVKVLFCTAVPSVQQNYEKRDRHIRFNSAQKARGTEVIEGHYVPEPIEDGGVPTGESKWTEKQTDINVALELIMDGLDDKYDVAMLLSADTDQVATARVFYERLRPTGKIMVGIAPPDRVAPIDYSKYKIPSLTIKKEDIEECLMPSVVNGNGKVINRPPEYAPPDGWLPPSQRPKQKPPKAPKVWGKKFTA